MLQVATSLQPYALLLAFLYISVGGQYCFARRAFVVVCRRLSHSTAAHMQRNSLATTGQ